MIIVVVRTVLGIPVMVIVVKRILRMMIRLKDNGGRDKNGSYTDSKHRY